MVTIPATSTAAPATRIQCHFTKPGGEQPRDRNLDGRWRKKRSDAGKPRK